MGPSPSPRPAQHGGGGSARRGSDFARWCCRPGIACYCGVRPPNSAFITWPRRERSAFNGQAKTSSLAAAKSRGRWGGGPSPPAAVRGGGGWRNLGSGAPPAPSLGRGAWRGLAKAARGAKEAAARGAGGSTGVNRGGSSAAQGGADSAGCRPMRRKDSPPPPPRCQGPAVGARGRGSRLSCQGFCSRTVRGFGASRGAGWRFGGG